jgi:hypothetical protein
MLVWDDEPKGDDAHDRPGHEVTNNRSASGN